MQKTLRILILLCTLATSYLQAQVISRFDFNDPTSLQTSTVGPFATSIDPAAASINGVLYMAAGCGNGVGPQVQVAGETFDVNNITIVTRYRRADGENKGIFFLRDDLEFGFNGRKVYVKYRVTDGLGTFVNTRINTNRQVSTAAFEDYHFFYDNCSGLGGILVNGDTAETDQGAANMALTFNNSSAFLSPDMDNSCAQIPGMDWIEIRGNSTTCLIPLPVELGSFSGRMTAGGAQLNWTTLNESNNDFFSIERSRDGSSFEKIGEVKSEGNSNAAQRYELLDPNTIDGTVFYRLRQTDLDGKSNLFPPIRLETQALENSFSIGPNPSKGLLWVNTGGTDGECLLQLLNLQGKTMGKWQLQGNSATQLQLGEFPTGIYIVQLQQGARFHQQRLLLQN